MDVPDTDVALDACIRAQLSVHFTKLALLLATYHLTPHLRFGFQGTFLQMSYL